MTRQCWVGKVGAFLLGSASGLLLAEQPRETLPGFKNANVFEVRGIDNINLFNGDPGVVIPLGPEYSLGPDNTFQLRAYYTAKFWKFDTSCQDWIDPDHTRGIRHAYVSGYPTLGAGWTLELGYFAQALEVEHFLEERYHAPDGGIPTSTRNRVTRYPPTGTPSSYTVEFPDGTRQIFDHLYSRPRPIAGSSNDLNDVDWDMAVYGWPVSPGPRYGLTSMVDSFGQTLYTVNYAASYPSADAWRVSSIVLNGGRVITYNWTTKNVAGTVWQVLASIDFPASGGQTLTVSFDRSSSDVIARNPFDNSDSPLSPCQNLGGAAVPLLTGITFGPPSIRYDFAYAPFGDPYPGTLKRITLPTQGTIEYTYVGAGGGTIGGDCRDVETTYGPEGLPEAPLDPSPGAHYQYYRQFVDNSAAVYERKATDPVTGAVSIITYQRRQCVPYIPGTYDVDELRIARRVNVTVKDRNGTPYFVTKSIFHVATYRDDATGFELARRYYGDANPSGTPIRTEVNCHAGGSDFGICGFLDSGGNVVAYSLPEDLLRQKEVTWYGVNPTGGGVCPQGATPCKASTSSGYVAVTNRYRTTTATSTFPGSPDRSSTTYWTPQTGSVWLLDLFNRQTQTQSGLTHDEYVDFDPANGFLRGRIGWDSSAGRVLANCYYPASPNTGIVQDEVSATALGFPTTPPNLCSPPYFDSLSTWPPNVIGVNGDAFGTRHGYQPALRLLTSTSWLNDHSPASWLTFNVVRDPSPGLITTSYDTAGLPTAYGYDTLGRLTQISPSGSETPTVITYDSTTQTTVTRSGGPGLSTWQRYIYDGFGRLIREIRQMPTGSASPYALRLTSYDDLNRQFFVSEWVGCASPATCAAQAVTAGTTSSSFDPFGRPQTLTRADGSTTSISYADGSVSFSDTQKTVTVNNVDGTCSGGSCSGGSSATTAYRYDAYGRLTQVIEPGGDLTFYSYDVNDKLTSVAQGSQGRNFSYDSLGFLRLESTPEKGTVAYNDSGFLLAYGSLGNVLRETHVGSGLLKGYCYDFAGRVRFVRTNEGGVDPNCDTPAGQLYLQNNYDQGGFGYSGGKLTTRTAWSYPPSGAQSVTDYFYYYFPPGRLSDQTTFVSGGPLPGVVQRWRYNALGLVAHHYHSRPNGASPFVVSMDYDAGLPTTEYVNGIPMVRQITYQSSGAIASYKTGINVGGDVTTTVQQDGALTRPARISTSPSLFDTGLYSYDGAGNVKQMGSDTFSYDLRSRLLSANLFGIGSQGYSYDQYGNLLTKGATTYCSGTCPSNQIPGATYVRGNLLAYSGQNFTYDGLDRMTSNQAATTYSYIYDGNDERVAKIGPTGVWSYTLRDESKRVVSEFGDASPLRDNVFLGNQLVASYTVANPDGAPAWAFYASDHLGTPRLVTNLLGTAVETRRYWPYGEQATAAAPFQVLRFATMEVDLEAGSGTLMADRYYDHARSHVGGLGRFLSPDVMSGTPEVPQSWNRYAYARNNPVRLVDPDGQAVVPSPELQARFQKNAAIRADVANYLERTGNGLFRPGVDAVLSVFLPTGPDFAASAMAIAGDVIVPEAGVATDVAQVTKNAQQGAVFEQKVGQTLEPGQTGVVSQVTLKTETGVKTRVDFAGRQAGTGEVALTEAKSSATAPLTKNQKAAFPEIAKTGATVQGQGKPGFLGGTKISPTEVKIKRPEDL